MNQTVALSIVLGLAAVVTGWGLLWSTPDDRARTRRWLSLRSRSAVGPTPTRGATAWTDPDMSAITAPIPAPIPTAVAFPRPAVGRHRARVSGPNTGAGLR